LKDIGFGKGNDNIMGNSLILDFGFGKGNDKHHGKLFDFGYRQWQTLWETF
jgi:hypothetical protein